MFLLMFLLICLIIKALRFRITMQSSSKEHIVLQICNYACNSFYQVKETNLNVAFVIEFISSELCSSAVNILKIVVVLALLLVVIVETGWLHKRRLEKAGFGPL